MRKLVYETIFDKMVKIGILDKEGKPTFEEYMKIENGPSYMPLSLDKLYSNKDGQVRISMAHNFIQNGDVMADPDMEIRIYPEQKMAEALTYQLDSLSVYNVVYPEENLVDVSMKKRLNAFLNSWLSNLIEEGFTAKNATKIV